MSGSVSGPSGPNISLFPGATFTTSQFANNRIFQRSVYTGGTYSAGFGQIAFSIVTTVPVFCVEYRLRDAVTSGNPVLQNWQPCAWNIAPGTSNITAYRVPASTHAYLFDTRIDFNDATTVLGTSSVSMGRLILAFGQSEISRFLKKQQDTTTLASLGITPSPYSKVFATYTAPTSVATPLWQTPADSSIYDSAGCATYLNEQISVSGCACGLVANSADSTVISQWVPGTANYTLLLANLASAGNVFEGLIMFLGASDSAASSNSWYFYASMQSIISSLQNINPNGFSVSVSDIQSVNTAFCTLAGLLGVRAAQQRWCADFGASYVNVADANLDSTNLEIGQVGYTLVAPHFYRASRPGLGLSLGGVGDLGPSIVSWSVSGSVVTVAMAQAGGTAFVVGAGGSWWTQFAVFNTGTTTSALTVSSGAIVSSTQLTLTLSSAPAGAVDVYLDGTIPSGTATNSNNKLYDNNTDSDGIAQGRIVLPSYKPSVPTQYLINQTSAFTYDTTTQKFGAGSLNGGYGTLAGGATPQFGGFANATVECWGKTSAAGSATQIMFGSTNYIAFGVSTGGFAYMQTSSGNSFTSTKSIVDGVWHHFRLVMSGFSSGTVTLCVDGVNVGTLAYTGLAVVAVLGIRQYGVSAGTTVWAGEMAELAFFNAALPTSFTPPTAQYTGNETSLTGLWHLQANGIGQFHN